MKILENKVAIVTGAGSGIGRAVAFRMAEEGASLVVSDVNEGGGRETAGYIADQLRKPAIFVRADSSISQDSEMLVQEAVKRFGKIDVAVNNAGISGPSAPIGEYPIEGWQKVLSINLSGVFLGMRYQIPALLKAGGGAIVNVASILGKVGFPDSCAYVAAKHGVVGLTQNAAIEYSAKNIRVNAVAPGFIETPLLNDMNSEEKKGLVALHPIGRLGKAEEVAELILWLSSDRASFVSGSCYAIDGGYLSR